MGVRPLAFHQRRWDDGRTLLRAPLGDTMVEAFGFPHYQTHRADLLATLVDASADRRASTSGTGSSASTTTAIGSKSRFADGDDHDRRRARRR